MKSFISRTVAAAVAAFALSGAAQAADSVNVAFFLEWATPNQIAKVDKAYDEAWVLMLTGRTSQQVLQ